MRDGYLIKARATFIAARAICVEFVPELKKMGDSDLQDLGGCRSGEPLGNLFGLSQIRFVVGRVASWSRAPVPDSSPNIFCLHGFNFCPFLPIEFVDLGSPFWGSQ